MGDERRRNGQNAAAMQVKGQARTWLLGLALAGCLALVACGGGDGDGGGGEQSIESLDVQELLDSAVIQFTELESFHFALDFGGDTSPLEQLSIDMEKIEGDVIIPDKLKAAVKAKVRSMGGINVNVSLVGVGEEAWVTNPFDPSVWLELESGNPLNGLFNPSDGVGERFNEFGEGPHDVAFWKLAGCRAVRR